MRNAIARLRNRDEGGFTLAELLVALVIQGLIMGALAMAFVGIMRGTGQVNQSLNKTSDARIAAQYIVSDARNSSGPEISLSDTASCTDPSPPVAGTASPVVRFSWDGTNSAGIPTPNVVNYVLVGTSLLRRQCVNGAFLSGRAVASSVADVDVTCSPTANCSGTPTSVTVTVTETPDANGTSYSYTLTTTFRKLIGDGPPVPATSILMLGGGGCTSGAATGLQVKGGAALQIYGIAKINTPDVSSCEAMSLGTDAGNYTAGGTQFFTGGSCSASGSSTCPTSTTYSPALTDPYASLPVPSTVGMPAQSGCPSGTAQPGVYASPLAITTSCTFASGTYVFQNGLSVTNSGAITSAAGGVFFYIAGGTFNESGNATVNLSAMTSGYYSGVLMWHAGTSPITISNGGTFAMYGALYSPNAQVQFSGGSVTTTITKIVAQSIVLSGGATVSIGSASATPLSITSTSPLQGWTVNKSGYSNTVGADGGDGDYSWSATNLPAGLSIDSSTGEISGQPTATGTKSVSVTLSDANGDTPVTKSLSITINAAPSISTTSPITNAEIGVSYGKTVVGSGGTTNYTWSATGLPAGLSINSSTGVIYGTPTGSPGTSTVNVTLTDAANASVSKNLSLTVVSAVSITTASLANGQKALAYSQTNTATGGQTSYTWSATGLPAGLSISSSTGTISGTPTVSGSFTINVTVTDALLGTDTNPYSVTINPQASISSIVLANGGSTQGLIEQNDTVTIVFSATMKASTICSAWTTNNTNYSITADNAVTVSVSNASPDVLTVTSSGCNLGSLNLGSSSYTSVAATFKGTGGNASTLTWTASTNTLVIKLGVKTAGTLATVASSAPVYTASASLRDAQNVALSSSTFNLPTQKHF